MALDPADLRGPHGLGGDPSRAGGRSPGRVSGGRPRRLGPGWCADRALGGGRRRCGRPAHAPRGAGGAAMARPGPRPGGGRHDRPPPRGRRAALRSDLGLLVHDGLRRRRQELVRTGTGGRGRDGSSGGVDLAPWEAVRRARRDAGAARVGGEPLLLATDELGQRRREGLPRGTCPASALGARRLDMGREGRGGRTDRDGHDGSRLGCARRASGRRGDASGHHLREHPLDRDARCEGDVDGLRAQDLLRGRDRRDGRDARFRGRRLPGHGGRDETRAG